MIRRRTLFSSALAASAALGLAACGKSSSSGSSASAGSGSAASDGGGASAIDAVSVGGEAGAEPTVSFTTPLSIDGTASKVVTRGDGAAIAAGDILAMRTLYVNAADGKVLQSFWQGSPANFLLIDATANGQEMVDFFTTATVGSRILMVGTVSSSSGASYDVVQVSDIVGTALKRAEGTPQPIPEGMPAFTLRDNGSPALDGTPTMAAPDTTQAAVTIQGAGETTAGGQTLAMHYTGWKLSDGSQFDSSWDRGEPFSFVLGTGSVIQGWDTGLLGRTVGSQVLLVIPPGEAYAGSQNELADETLIFVADILDAVDPAAG